MSISDGQQVNASNSNTAWASKSADNTLTGKQTLNRAGSGAQVDDVQQDINTAKADIATAQNDITNLQSEMTAAQTDITNLQTLSGRPDGSTDLGTFSGTTFSDNENVKNVLQEAETAIEARELSANKGAANGYAPLDGSSKVPAANLPSYVDDVLEYADLASFPVTGETGKIYIALDTERTYRWTGSIYVEVSPSPVESVNGQTGVVVLDTDDISEGTTNKYFTDARAKTAVVDDAIVDGVTDKAPSQNAVFDALANKQNTGNYITALTGDVTASGPGSSATTISADAVDNTKLSNMATQTIKGRTTAGTGDPEDLSATQATAILNNFVGDSGSGGTKGMVPAPAAGDAAANKFLKADGTWAASGASGQSLTTQEFTASGNFAVPSGVTEIIVTLAGGGGGGGGGGDGSAGSNGGAGGGGGAGCLPITLHQTVTPSDNLTVTIGAGGAAGTNAVSGNPGGTGGTTTITGTGVNISSTGGAGGAGGGASSGAGGAGGVSNSDARQNTAGGGNGSAKAVAGIAGSASAVASAGTGGASGGGTGGGGGGGGGAGRGNGTNGAAGSAGSPGGTATSAAANSSAGAGGGGGGGGAGATQGGAGGAGGSGYVKIQYWS